MRNAKPGNHLKHDNVKIWAKVIIVTFFYAIATVDVVMAISNDVILPNLDMYILHDYEIVVSF